MRLMKVNAGEIDSVIATLRAIKVQFGGNGSGVQ